MVQGNRDAPDAGGPFPHVTSSPSDVEINTSLRSWLLTVVPDGYRVIQGQQNGTAAPSGPFILFTPLFRRRIATNASSYSSTTRDVVEPMELTFQISAFGDTAGEAVQRISALWRDMYAADWLSNHTSGVISPLTASEPRQTGFINSDKQYENNWTIDLRLQVNFTVSAPQQFAQSITIDLREVDASFPDNKE